MIRWANAINIDERIEIASAFQTSAAHRADREAVSARRANTMREPLSPRVFLRKQSNRYVHLSRRGMTRASIFIAADKLL